MLNTFSQNQKGGVSPQFAILVSVLFLSIGAALYMEGDTVYQLFDNIVDQVRYAVKI